MPVLSNREWFERYTTAIEPIEVTDHAGKAGWTTCPVCGRECYRVPCCKESLEWRKTATVVMESGEMRPELPISPIAFYSLDELIALGDELLLGDDMIFVDTANGKRYRVQRRTRKLWEEQILVEIVDVEVTHE